MRFVPQSLPDALVRGLRKERPRRQPEQRPARTRRRSAVALAGVPLFEGFTRRHLAHLAHEADEVAFEPGEHVVEEGLLGETLYVILEGQARVVRGGRRVARLLPGDFFGELSAIDGGPRTASVVAETPLLAVRLFRHTLVDLLRREPLLTVKLLQGIAKRIREVERPISA
ncbi:MAG: cyclic nucleotide-binding domain-containing protein [Actinobacteria bacterium]|nr:cyclic nucleotide-binding domain-containing protein [Actinomycetota bacterium]